MQSSSWALQAAMFPKSNYFFKMHHEVSAVGMFQTKVSRPCIWIYGQSKHSGDVSRGFHFCISTRLVTTYLEGFRLPNPKKKVQFTSMPTSLTTDPRFWLFSIRKARWIQRDVFVWADPNNPVDWYHDVPVFALELTNTWVNVPLVCTRHILQMHNGFNCFQLHNGWHIIWECIVRNLYGKCAVQPFPIMKFNAAQPVWSIHSTEALGDCYQMLSISLVPSGKLA